MNQTAVITDFIELGACVNANCTPGMANNSSPIINSRNCGSCQRMDIDADSDRCEIDFYKNNVKESK